MPSPQTSQRKRYLCYRAGYSSGYGRFVDSLKQVFSEDQIFMDIEKLERVLIWGSAEKSLETCDVLFAVIDRWVGIDKTVIRA